MKFYLRVMVSCLLAGLHGCANIDYKANLQQASVCCNQFSDIQYQPLEYGKPLAVDVGGSKSQARNFPEGKSFFMPVQLPEFVAPYEVQISSAPSNQQLSVPSVLLLNDQYQVVKRIPSTAFDYSNGVASHKFFLNKDEGWRYMVLYTATQEVGKESERRDVQISTNSVSTGTAMFFFTTGSDVKQKIKTAEGGNLTINAIKYQPRDIK